MLTATAATAEDVAEAARSTSLACTDQMVTTLPPLTCGFIAQRYMIDPRSMKVWVLRCKRNTCLHCLPINARRRALGVGWMEPYRMVRFSLLAGSDAADPMDVARTRMKRLRQALRRAGVPMGEWSWTLEKNPKETGYHAHAVQHGPYIPQAQLAAACEKAGAGYPSIEKIKGSRAGLARYGMKAFGAAGYGMKTFAKADEAEEALFINHGRLEHHTREFFQLDGKRAKVRVVEKKAIESLFPRDDRGYVVCNRETAEFFLSPAGRHFLQATAANHARGFGAEAGS